MSTSFEFETELWRTGFSSVAGVDEAGRGPLAGPVVAAACILPRDFPLEGLTDSKKLSGAKRDRLYDLLTKDPQVHFAIGIIDSQMIDEINILQASLLAMKLAIEKLSVQPDFALIDGNHLPNLGVPCKAIIDGDALSYSIAAASIIAKVVRDRMMDEYHQQWPQYGFDKHKGYGTKKHLQALDENGPCTIHRFSFAPVKERRHIKANILERVL